MFWDNPAPKLAENARGSSVTEKRLTKTGARIIGAGYPEERPIIDYLEEGEQPHHIFYNKTKGVTLFVNGAEKTVEAQLSHSTFAVLTDRRVVVIVPTKDGDIECGTHYEGVQAARFQTGKYEHQMDIAAGNDGLTFPINNSISATEVEAARAYVMPRLNPDAVSGSIVDDPQFDIANDVLDLNMDIVDSKQLHIGVEAPGEEPSEPVHRSDDSSEMTEHELVELLHGLDAYSFEELIADIWKQRGWEAKATQESGDRGIDVIAERSDPIPEKQLIQAKKYKEGNTVGSRDVQQYSSLRHQQSGVDAVAIVTTSTFTKQASELATDLNVKLVDIDMLCEMVRLEDAYDVVRWHAGVRETERQSEQTGSETEGSDRPVAQAEDNETAPPDPIEEIRRVRELADEGLLSEDEFEAKKQELLDRI